MLVNTYTAADQSQLIVNECNKSLDIFISNQSIMIKCSNIYNLSINYEQIKNYKFNLINSQNENRINIINLDFPNQKNSIDKIQSIASILSITPDIDIIYKDFLMDDSLIAASNFFYENPNIWITMSWEKYMYFSTCPWDGGKYKNEYVFLKHHFENLEENPNWLRICINSNGYLIKQDNSIQNLIVVNKSTLIIFIIIAIIIVIAIIILSIYVSYRKYKKENAQELS